MSQAKCVSMYACETRNILHDNTTTLEPYLDHLGFSLLHSDSIMIGDKVVAKCKFEGKIYDNRITVGLN